MSKVDILMETSTPEKLKKDLKVLHDLLENIHPGVFAYNNKAGFENLFDSISSSITTPISKPAFLNKVDYIIDKVHCAHSGSYFPQKYYDDIAKRALFFPVPMIKIGDKIYVNSDNYPIANGSEVLSINNYGPKELFRKMLFHTHTDGLSLDYKDEAINEDFAYNYFLSFGPADSYTVKVRDAKSNKTKNYYLCGESLNKINEQNVYYKLSTDSPYEFELIPEKNAAILSIKTFEYATPREIRAYSDFLKNTFAILDDKKVKNLIIDYRNNPGGYFRSSYLLLSYFVSTPLVQFDSVIRRFNKLPYKDLVSDSAMGMQVDRTYTEYSASGNRYLLSSRVIDTCFPSLNVFKGKLFIITNGNVISAAASSAALLKERAGAVIVGQETGGGYSAFNSGAISYTLPSSGIKVDIPTIRYYPPVTNKKNTNGVKPDHFVTVTKKDFKEYNDGPMNYILTKLIKKH